MHRRFAAAEGGSRGAHGGPVLRDVLPQQDGPLLRIAFHTDPSRTLFLHSMWTKKGLCGQESLYVFCPCCSVKVLCRLEKMVTLRYIALCCTYKEKTGLLCLWCTESSFYAEQHAKHPFLSNPSRKPPDIAVSIGTLDLLQPKAQATACREKAEKMGACRALGVERGKMDWALCIKWRNRGISKSRIL